MQAPVYGFGEWQLDSGQRLLFRSGALVPLPPKVLETLLVLVEHRGRIVEKEELLSRLWPDTIVEEGNVLRNVSTLRKALKEGDGRDGSELIETIPRRGYRFLAPVRLLESGEQLSAAPPPPPVILPVDSPRTAASARHHRIRRPALILGAITVLLAAGYFGWQRWRSMAAAPRRAAFVVLPFQSLSGSAENEYLVDGLTEEVITQLAGHRPDQIAVIARTSAMKYKSERKTVAEVGRELGVDYVLEGSVRQQGGQLRISVQLIQVKDQMHLWARNYDRDLGGVITLQDELARDIAEQVRGTLQPAARAARRRTASPEAYDAYLRGRYHWNTRTEEGLNKALAFFSQALEKDPEFAQAHSGVADVYNLLANFQFLPTGQAFPRAIASARKALELDDALADAHASLAFAKFYYDYDWPGAEASFRRAIELNPSHARAHLWFSTFLAAMARHEEALGENRIAQELDPLSTVPRINAGRLAFYSRQYGRAIDEMRGTLRVDPNQPWAHLYAAMAHAELGEHSQAAERAIQARGISGGRPGPLDAYCFAVAGRATEAREILDALEEHRREANLDLVLLAGIHSVLGERDEALQLLDQARAERSLLLPFASVFPWLAPLYADPRFHDFLRDLRLPPVRG